MAQWSIGLRGLGSKPFWDWYSFFDVSDVALWWALGMFGKSGLG